MVAMLLVTGVIIWLKKRRARNFSRPQKTNAAEAKLIA